MRTVLGWTLVVLGVPVLLAGVVAAGYVGPDDTVGVVDETLTADTSVISASGSVLGVEGPTIHLTVDGGDAETFVGVAHPVHVDSYLADVARTDIIDVGWNGDLDTEPIDGDDDAPRTEPAGLDWWQQSVTGTGERSVTFELTDEPFSMVIANAALDGPVDVAVTADVEIDHLFTFALAVTIGGVLMVIGGVVLLRAQRRRRADQGTQTSRGEEASQEGGSDATAPAVAGDTSGQAERRGRRVRLVALGGVGALLVAGCADVPQEVEIDATAPVRAITPEAAEAFFEHYTTTNNTANAQRDKNLIATVESGLLYETSTFGYEIDEARGRDSIEQFTMTPQVIAAPELDAYPMWAVVTERVNEGAEPSAWHLLTRADASSSWRVALAMHPEKGAEPPVPVVEDGVAVLADEAIATRGQEVLDDLVGFVSSGTEPADVDLAHASGLEQLATHGLDTSGLTPEIGTANNTCAVERADDVHWLATDSGGVVIAAVSCTQELQLNPGYTATVQSAVGIVEAGAQITQSTITTSATVVIAVGDDGAATVYGQDPLIADMNVVSNTTP